MVLNMDFGEQIKFLRTKKKITQKELADKMGVTASWVGMYESGRRKPKIETIARFANALEVDPRSLLQGEINEICERYVDVNPNDSLYDRMDATIKNISTGILLSGKIREIEEATALANEDELIRRFRRLNHKGQRIALERLEELGKINEYTEAIEEMEPPRRLFGDESKDHDANSPAPQNSLDQAPQPAGEKQDELSTQAPSEDGQNGEK